MNYQRILSAYNPDHDLPGADQPPVTWVEYQLANEVAQLRAELTQLQADLRRYTHCAYCGERLGDYHQCTYTLAEDADAAAMRAYTLEQRQRQEDRG